MAISISLLAGLFLSLLNELKDIKPGELIKKTFLLIVSFIKFKKDKVSKINSPKKQLKLKDTLGRYIILPFVITMIFITLSLINPPTIQNYLIMLEIVGLFILILGTIFGLRPLVRNLIDPEIKKPKDIEEINKNAGIVAFVYILIGFSLQLASKLILLVNLDLFMSLIFTFIVLILVGYGINKVLNVFDMRSK